MKKILKYCFISIGILFLTLLILPFTLYIPAIQSWAKDLATTYASKQLNMSIAIERIRLKFPLNLVLDDAPEPSPPKVILCYIVIICNLM